MMFRETKYIIRRILIGVGIALVMMFLKTNVFAMTVSSVVYNNSSTTITNSTFYTNYSLPGYWASWGTGYVNFSFSITKTVPDATSPVVLPRSAIFSTSTADFICNIGSTNTNNSTFEAQVYSATCPVNIGSSGLTLLTINLTDNAQNSTSTYKLQLDGHFTFYNDSPTFTQNNTDIINAQNSTSTAQNNNRDANFGNLITDNRANTQAIINNQNANSQAEIESQKVCEVYDKKVISTDNYFLGSNGELSSNSLYGITDYINITNSEVIPLATYGGGNTCFYNDSKVKISCIYNTSFTVNQPLTLPTGAFYMRFSINKDSNRPQFKVCKNGNQAIAETQQEINNTLNNDDVTGATGDASDFFSDFSADSHGLSGIITSPLRLIQGLSTASCSSLSIPLPFVNQNATIPCMSTIYSLYPTFYNLWQLLTTGLIAYWIVIKIFGHVKGMQNPNDDRIEVVNL